MGKKIFLYDSYGYEFYACEFEGLDANGKPRLTIMTPGCPVENFLEHLELMDESPCDYNLLCEEGECAASKLIFDMLAQIYLRANQSFEKVTSRFEEIQKYGISYDRNLLNVKVRISEYENEESEGTSYRLYLDFGGIYIDDTNMFKDVKDIIIKLCGFFFYIENHVHIPVKKYLEVSESLKKLVMRHSTNLFDKVETI